MDREIFQGSTEDSQRHVEVTRGPGMTVNRQRSSVHDQESHLRLDERLAKVFRYGGIPSIHAPLLEGQLESQKESLRRREETRAS